MGKAGERVLGIDLGGRRIGIALSDPSGVIASPHGVIVRSGDRKADHRRLAELVSDLGVGLVVVGLPLSLAGTETAAARNARAELGGLGSAIPVPVVAHDERYTTVEAQRRRQERGQPDGASSREASSRHRRPRVRPPRGPKVPIDAEAAAVMLQSFLESRRNRAGSCP